MGFEELGKKLARLGQDTKNGVQKMGESYQINAKIGEERKKLEQLYRAVGEAVYQANKEKGLEGFEEEFEVIGTVLENIAVYTQQLNKVKGVLYCSACGREASKGERFCSGCGAKLPEVEADISEKMKQDAKEAVGEAGEIMGDVVDKAKGLMGSVADKADAFVKGVSSKINSRGSNEAVYDLNEDEVKVQEAEPESESSEAGAESTEAAMEAEAENTEAVEEAEAENTEAVMEAEAEPESTEAAMEAEPESTGAAVEAEAENAETAAPGRFETETEAEEAAKTEE